MFGTYSYHQTTRYTIAVFGSLFNNIDIVRKTDSDQVVSQDKVPIAYGPRQKWISHLEHVPDHDDTRVATTLPRMSYELTTFTYDAARQTNQHCTTEIGQGSDGSRAFLRSGTPWLLNFELNIYARRENEAYQILEQILPHFRPSYSLTFKPLTDRPTVTQDVKFTLNSVTQNNVYEGPMKDRQTFIITLNFAAAVQYYPPIQDGKVIKTAIANINTFDDETLIVSTEYAVDPSSADRDDSYTINVTETFGFDE